MPDLHKAWTWQGSPEPSELVLAETPIPRAGPGEVLIRNTSIGLNPVDWKVLDGSLVQWQPGKVPGVDGAGIVFDIGPGVHHSWLGARVAYHQDLHKPGSFAEVTPVAARALLRVPEGMDLATAGSLPCPGLTAWLAMDKLPTKPGQRMLVAGAGGAVGHHLVQMASGRGFHVTAMSHPRHHARLVSLGAHETVAGPLLPTEGTSSQRLSPFYAVVDAVSGEHARQLSALLKGNGHLVCIQDRLDAPAWAPFGAAISQHEVALGAMHSFGDDPAWAELVHGGETIMRKLVSGDATAPVTTVSTFERLPEALDSLRHRNFSEKPMVVI